MNRKLLVTDNLADLGLRRFKEVIFDPTVYSFLFSQENLHIDLITTQSNMLKVPPAFMEAGGCKKIMAWYSTNSKPIFAIGDSRRKSIEVAGFKSYVDEHWVWNKGDVDFLQSNGLSNVVPVGSIVFQDRILGFKSDKSFVITFFDVTPHHEATDFYSEKNTSTVLQSVLELRGILEAKFPNQVVIQLKPKRGYAPSHSHSYISMVNAALREGTINVLPPSSNLYKTISSSDLVLAIPFTSPALIAKEMNIQVNYVAIGISDWDIPDLSDGISVVKNLADLTILVEKAMSQKFSN
jgi:polysaccharide biosynthesis PFTS motif protein